MKAETRKRGSLRESLKSWLTYWKYTLGGVMVVAIALLVLTRVGTAVSPRSGLCANCHEIQPVYEQWQASTHKGIDCLNCHTEPGLGGYAKANLSGVKNMLTHVGGTYDMPLAATVDNSSCLRCHPRETLPEVIPAGTLRVAHSKHDQQRCTDCHSQVVHTLQGATVAQAKSHANKDCRVCHPNPASAPHGDASVSCLSCHSATIPNHDLAMKRGVFPQEGCIDCHTKQRVSAPEECQVCHVSPHGLEEQGFKANCSACHASTETWTIQSMVHPVKLEGKHTQLQCAQCHNGRTDFKGLSFDCSTCHKPSHGQMKENDCTSCHSQQGFKPAKVDHQKIWSGYQGKHASIECAQCHPNNWYAGIPSKCETCHKAPKGMENTDCAKCHQPGVTWKIEKS